MFMFADSESRSPISVKEVGAYKYHQHPQTDNTVWGWCSMDGPGRVWSPDWAWSGGNADIDELLEHVERGFFLIAWNAAFDRHHWNAVMVAKYGWPYLHLEQVLCAQAQAEANNLPGKLEKAAEAAGATHKKQRSGSRLMGKFAQGTREDWPEAYRTSGDMGVWRSYCKHDCLAMRDIWKLTRPLTDVEWREYHASERVNDRGVAVDVPFAVAASTYAKAEFKDINGQLAELTGDKAITVSAHLRKAQWLHDELWPDEDLRALVERPDGEKEVWGHDDAGEPCKVTVPHKRFGADRSTRDALLEALVQPEHSQHFEQVHRSRILTFLELVEAGNSAAARKFGAIANMAIDRRIYGQYSFNGAGQTGRFSSRGVQIHNLIRAIVEKGNPDRAMDAIEDVLAGLDAEALAVKYKLPVSRLLARLVRPTFIAPEGRMLVWADYDQVEGRMLPFLANSRLAELKLDVYRSGKDVYRETAGDILSVRPDDIDEGQRQAFGKVPELSLGFGGSVGALTAMARSYGVVLPEGDDHDIVKRWRAANPWAQVFWYQLRDAAMAAFRNAGHWYKAGRVRYLFHPALLRGTLICELPSRRWIIYPHFKHEQVDVEDDNGVMRQRWRTSFRKGFSSGTARVDFWYGMQAENVTQAAAADILRGAVVKLEDSLVLHTHDEAVGECDIDKVEDYTDWMTGEMTRLPAWADGLPLTVSAEHGPYYTK